MLGDQVANEDTVFLIGVINPVHQEKAGLLEKQEAHTLYPGSALVHFFLLLR